jgi:hypothetical protein
MSDRPLGSEHFPMALTWIKAGANRKVQYWSGLLHPPGGRGAAMKFGRLSRHISLAAVLAALLATPAVAQNRDHGGGNYQRGYAQGHSGYLYGGHGYQNNSGAIVGGALLGLGAGAVLGGAPVAPPPIVYAPPPPRYYYNYGPPRYAYPYPPPPAYYGY